MTTGEQAETVTVSINYDSTDELAAFADSFGPPVPILRQSNQGESVTRNRGLAEARGTHVLFLDADDLLAPEALAHLSESVQNRPGAVALMGCGWFDGWASAQILQSSGPPNHRP